MSGVTDPRNLGRAVEGFLRARYPSKTVDNVVADTGLSPHQVGKWLEGAHAPSGVAFARLTLVYGPEFLAAVFPSRPAWVERAVDEHRLECLKAERAALDQRIRDFHAGR